MPKICVTADDYGMHREVNAAIEELAARRRISAVAVMVHEGAVLDTLDRLRATGVALGLHLVVTQERPVNRSLTGTSLAADGRLPESVYSLARVLARDLRLRHLLCDELAAQVTRYRSLGLPLHFINSHEHAHEMPLVWGGIARIVDRERPDALRSARVQPLSLSRQGALALLSRASWRVRRTRAPVQLLSPLGAGIAGRMTLPTVRDLVERGLSWHRGSGVLPELVVHPATADDELRASYGPKVGDRRAEYELLGSEEIAALWRQLGVELASPASA